MPIGSSKFIDRTGQRYGSLTVIERGPPSASGASWFCRCDCGSISKVTAVNLKRPNIQCLECSRSSKREDLTGKVFTRLTVLGFAESRNGKPMWKCRCECGNESLVNSQNLKNNRTRSCGCFSAERTSAATRKHGMTSHPLYDAWTNIKQRCFNEKHPNYHRYGGRGISICDRWMEFENFKADMEPSWIPGLTIERKDVNGHYEPSNCEWITRRAQSRNQERTITVEVDGKPMTIPEAAEKFGINSHTLRQRWQRGVRGDALFVVRHRTRA